MVAASALQIQVADIPVDVLGAAFQQRLRLAAPELGRLSAAPDVHGAMLLRCLGLLAAYRGGERYSALCRRLAHRLHKGGLRALHYDALGAALLGSLHEALGARFDDAVESFWGGLYGESAEAMLASLGAESR